jgi:integrase
MPRRAVKPRYWQSKGGYYMTVNKQTVLLAKGPKDDAAVIARAEARARELLAGGERSLPTPTNFITAEDIKMLAEVAAPHLLHALDFLWVTGCRPEEAVAARAADLDEDRKAVWFHQPEHLVPLEDSWLVYDSLAMGQQGPFLRNSRGKPWTVDALHGAFSRLRDRLGLNKHLTLMAFRHGYAIEALSEMNVHSGDIPEKLAGRMGISLAHLRDLYGDHIPRRFWK